LHTRFEFEVGDSQLPLQYFYAEMVGESQHVDGFTGLATGLDFSKIKKRASLAASERTLGLGPSHRQNTNTRV
jgi:hypothetical protein